MCFKIPVKITIPKPVVGTVTVTRQEYLANLALHGITPISDTDPFDSTYNLCPVSELIRIAPSLVYPADWYAEDLWDCENYGLQAANDAGKFKCSVVLCLGTMELGYHGFALAQDASWNIWLLEPNAGFPWAGVWFEPSNQNMNYQPKKVLI